MRALDGMLVMYPSQLRGCATGAADPTIASAYTRGEVRDEPLIVQLGPGRLSDIIPISQGLIISERVQAVFAGAGLAGWSTYPVNLRAWPSRTEPLPPSHEFIGFAVTGRCDSIRFGPDVSRLEHEDPLGWPIYRGLFVSADGYTGDDFFMGADCRTNVIVVTPAVQKITARSRIRGVVFESPAAQHITAHDLLRESPTYEALRQIARSVGTREPPPS